MRATLGMIERAIVNWISGRGANRAQTHALIANSILATIREVLPAVMRADGESRRRP